MNERRKNDWLNEDEGGPVLPEEEHSGPACLPALPLPQDKWAGASCSVDLSSLSSNSSCVPGSRLPKRDEAKHATCWAACDAETGGP